MGIPSLMILCASLVSFSLPQNSVVPRQCVIIQDRQKLSLPRVVPSFLITKDNRICHTSDRQALQCGNTDVFIKPECVCSFYNVHEAKYHPHTACPRGQTSDHVIKLKCPDCKRYSLDNKGPCINGGNLTCRGEEVAPASACDCPRGFSGMFCETQMIKVVRICDRTEGSSHPYLNNCDITKRECLTYSENKRYVFKCSEYWTSEKKQGNLPFCNEVEMRIEIGSRTTKVSEKTTNPSGQNNTSPFSRGEEKNRSASISIRSISVNSKYKTTQSFMSVVPRQCMIIQDKQKSSFPRVVPSFLTTEDKRICHTSDRQALQCGNTDVFINPKCVCSFYNVYEEKYHSHTACSSGQPADHVIKLRCPDCKRYSLDNKGPCINGGNLTCRGEEVAPMITCDCPSGFSGMFCENQMIKVVRICDRTEGSSHPYLNNCDITKKECLTYSKNNRYVFKCNETLRKEEKEKQGNLPLCSEVEMEIEIGSRTTKGPQRVNNTSDRNKASLLPRDERDTSGVILSISSGLVFKSLL